MTADELRELADALEPMASAPRFDGLNIPALTDYLRACADAMDAGPVAWLWQHDETGRTVVYEYPPDSGVAAPRYHCAAALYPVAMPAPLRLPEPMADEEAKKLGNDLSYLPTMTDVVVYIEAETLRRVKEMNE